MDGGKSMSFFLLEAHYVIEKTVNGVNKKNQNTID